MLEICYYANKAFESQIFCSIMVSFLVTLFCLYGALYTVSNPIPGREDSEVIILLFFVREIAVHAIPALILVYICGKILKKVRRITELIRSCFYSIDFVIPGRRSGEDCVQDDPI